MNMLNVSFPLLTGITLWGGLGGSLLGKKAPDLDSHVTRTRRSTACSLKIAELEKMIRENPVARTADLLQKNDQGPKPDEIFRPCHSRVTAGMGFIRNESELNLKKERTTT